VVLTAERLLPLARDGIAQLIAEVVGAVLQETIASGLAGAYWPALLQAVDRGGE
jgi:hypothetical protein